VPLEKIHEDIVDKSHSKNEISTIENMDLSSIILNPRSRRTLKNTNNGFSNFKVHLQKDQEKAILKDIFESNETKKDLTPKLNLNKINFTEKPSIHQDFNPTFTTTSVEKLFKRKRNSVLEEPRNSVIRDVFTEHDKNILATPASTTRVLQSRDNESRPNVSSGESNQDSRVINEESSRSSRYFLSNDNDVSRDTAQKYKVNDGIEEYQL
jgi:hypothetical protein